MSEERLLPFHKRCWEFADRISIQWFWASYWIAPLILGVPWVGNLPTTDSVAGMVDAVPYTSPPIFLSSFVLLFPFDGSKLRVGPDIAMSARTSSVQFFFVSAMLPAFIVLTGSSPETDDNCENDEEGE